MLYASPGIFAPPRRPHGPGAWVLSPGQSCRAGGPGVASWGRVHKKRPVFAHLRPGPPKCRPAHDGHARTGNGPRNSFKNKGFGPPRVAPETGYSKKGQFFCPCAGDRPRGPFFWSPRRGPKKGPFFAPLGPGLPKCTLGPRGDPPTLLSACV